MKLSIRLALLFALPMILFACSRQKQLHLVKFGGAAQGTYYSISYYAHDSISCQHQVDSLLQRFDSSLSTYKPNSIVSRFNANDPEARADGLFSEVWQKAMAVSQKTGGAFDITVGPLVNAWGFGFTNRMKVDRQVVDSLLPLVGYSKVQLTDGKLVKSDLRQQIDFNAIAQGFSVDVVGRYLSSRGIDSYLVDIGGEVLARGTKPDGKLWNVAIEMPSEKATDERTIQAIVNLKDMAVSTSGSYRKYFEENGVRYSHTIDPATGYPVTHSLLSVTVLASDCTTADAFATAFMVMGLEKSKLFLQEHTELDAYFITHEAGSGLSVFYTKGFGKILANPH